MFGGGSPREEFFADGALTHALTDDKEHLADLVVARGASASLRVFVSNHVAFNDEF